MLSKRNLLWNWPRGLDDIDHFSLYRRISQPLHLHLDRTGVFCMWLFQRILNFAFVTIVLMLCSIGAFASTTLGRTEACSLENCLREEKETEQMLAVLKSHMANIKSLLNEEQESYQESEQNDHSLALKQEKFIDEILLQVEEEEREESKQSRALNIESTLEGSQRDLEEETNLTAKQQELVEQLLREIKKRKFGKEVVRAQKIRSNLIM